MSFRKAITECKKKRMNLAIEDSETYLGRLKLADNSFYWLGLIKNSKNNWQWTDRTFINKKMNSKEGYNCGAFDTSKNSIVAMPCSIKLSFLCQGKSKYIEKPVRK